MAARRKGKRVATPDGVRVFGKARNSEGSVYRQADGRWCATWWVPGEKRPRKATGKTQQEAIERRAKRREQAGLDLGRAADGRRLWPTGGCTTCTGMRCGRRRGPSPRTGCAGSRRRSGDLPVVDLDYRVVTEWQAKLGRTLAPRTVRHHRQTLAQVVDEAVKMGALVGNPVRAVKPLRVTDSDGVALDRDETRALLAAVADHRLGAAVALLFLQGWRVSEVLGLAWEDLDLDAGTALRAAGVGLRRRPRPAARAAQDRRRAGRALADADGRRPAAQAPGDPGAGAGGGAEWETHTYEGEPMSLVFTTPTGGLVLRQTVAKVVKQAAKTAGITAHARRRTPGVARWSPRCSWTATRRWRTSPGSSGTPSPRPPPAM